MNRYSLFFLRETRSLIRIALNKNAEQIGLLRFSTPDPRHLNPTIAYLHNVEVTPDHRNSRIGSRLLQKMEMYLKINNPETEQINGVLWDDQTNPYLHQFFNKNGFELDRFNQAIYDDGISLIDVIPLTKKI